MRCLVTGAGGFIGHNLVARLRAAGHYVEGVDIQYPEFESSSANVFHIADLTSPAACLSLFRDGYDEIYNLAAMMGGAGLIFTQKHDAKIIADSTRINLNVADSVKTFGGRLFFSSSACAYNAKLQLDPANPGLKETDVYPAWPDSAYGWSKLHSEIMFDAYARNYGLNVRIARLHNVYGINGCFDGGREKAPAAICRKVALAADHGEIEMWGDGEQTRSFLYIDDCLDGIEALMASDCREPVNIGSDEMVSINKLAEIAMGAAGKQLTIKHIPGPLGVRGRNSDNTFCKAQTGWSPKISLADGVERTYAWIADQLKSK